MNGSLDSQHSNVEGISWPSLPTDLKNPQPHARAEHRISFTTPISRECPLTILCQAALAALLSRYTRADDVAYDIVLPNHDSTPIIRSCHSHVDTEQSRSDLMRNIQEQAAAVSRDGSRLPGANDAREESAEDTSAVENQTVLAVSNLEHLKAPNGRSDRAESFPPQTDRALLLECQFSAKSLSLIALYDPNVIDRPQIQRFLRQLGIAIEQFHGDHLNLPVHDINVLTREDREDIKSWNATPPPTGTGNIQDVIAGWATSSPDNAAVFAWDGDLTYSQLDDLSSRLALRIKAFNLAKESIIPLYFEKSKWTVVSMLAVLKAGAAFTLVDPSVPRDRVENICQQTSPKLALVCKSKGREMQGLVPDCFTVDEESVKSLQMAERGALPISKPEDLAYVMFTSGSTGQPKGAMNEHRGITSFAPAMGPTLKIDQNSRILQFASYAYAVSVTEMFAPLCTGGCICIPSENDRMNDLVGFIQQSRATFMFITPSFVKSIQPESVPSLETLALVGEPMTPETRDIWAKRVHLMNAVGQSECLWTSIVTVDADEPDPRLIGRGSGTRLWITEVGNSDRLAPVGCAGELLIESCGRGRGYLHADEAATAKFVSKAPSWYPQGCEPNDSSMFYRTGDLACYRSDGSIVNIGREDTQVKIRGQRVELSGVEFQLRQIMPEGVTPIVEVVRRSNEAGREMLVAFIAQPHSHSSNEDPMSEASILDNDTASHFTKQLGTQMGRHAIPSYYVNLKTLPYTATGKTNRGRLRAIGTELLSDKDRSVASRSQDALPRGGPEVAMAQLWARSMSIDAGSITKDDNFFDLGGDSIMAVAIANKARGAGIPLKVADVLEHPVLSDLVATTSQQEPMHPSEGESIPVQPRHGDTAELSYAQRGLWFLEQLNPGTPAYNVSIAGRLRGPLQVDALMNALQALEQRHETLRTTFEQHNGAPVQVIQPCRTAKDTLQLINAATDADLHSALQQQQVAAFDLTSSPPWRVALLRVGADDHVLSIVMHHIISDGWSDDVLRRDLAKFYATAVAGHDLSKPLEPLPIQYRDFVAWQQSDAQQSRQQEQLQYWTKQLADSAPAELLLDMPRPKLPSGRAGNVEVTLERPLYQALQKFCNAQQTTTFVVLLAAFRATHYRLTGHEDATIGTPNASRSRSELEDLVGFFSNTQCIRIPVQDATFTTLVQQVKATVTAALAHQDVPFERVVSEVLGSKARDASRNPLVQILFAVHSQPSLGEIHLEGLSGEAMQGTESTRFDLEFHLVQRAEGIRGNVLFAKELFRPETMQAMVNTFQDVLRRGLVEPEASINALRLEDGLIELRNRGFLEVATTEYPRDSSIVDIFAQQVAASPQEPAAKDSSSQLTYAELDSLSDVLAAWLRQHDFPPESWVGVLAGRSCQTIVAFIGILKANLAYVPLDIDAPSSRVEGILSSFEGRKLILLGDGVETPDIPVDGLDFARLSDALDQEVDESKSRTKCLRPSAASLAYVMFTSGSTGKPKGVAIEHRGVVRLVKQTNVLSQLPKAMVVAHLFNIAFDLSVWEIYTALLNGGTIICIDATTKLDPRALEETFMREHIQAAMLPPVLLKTCLATSPKIFKDLLAFYNGADRFDSHDAALTKALMPQARVVNAYGPTENSALSTIYDVKQDDHLTNGVPIGEPISNSGAYVMDVNQNLVPIGVMGELVVTGDGLARGYTDPSLNKNVFVEVGIDSKQVRAYRTGDRVRRRPRDGQIEFFGRLDRQTKIRGYRIEMAEVEHAMLKQNEVNDAAIVLHQRDGEEADLIGFITTQDANDSGYEEETNGQVESWGRQFDNNFYNGIGDIDQSVLGSDFLGWTSMYSGEKIPRPEMQEWLDDIVQTMLDAQPAGRVLDLGTGTGMVLFNLGDGLENYVGLDPSKPAVTFATEKLKQVPGLADKAKVHVGAATDVGNIDSERSELVVLNSVLQYFPSPEYLSEVIDNIARIPHVKRLFIGDVRSYAINRQFLASRALYKLGEEASKNDIRQEMARLEDREEELLVSPAFFTSLKSQMPDLVEHVEVLPKKMEATNELSSYRYSAVVHFKRANVPEQVIRGMDGHDWVDFKARGMDIESLTQLLKKSSDQSLVAISNMPYSKTIRERYIVETLDAEEDQDTSNKEDWLEKATQSAERCPSVDPTDLVALAKKTGFRVEINWARQSSQHGGLDAIFHHYEPSHEGARVKFRFPADDDGKPSKSAPLSNRPLQSLRNIQIEKRVRDALQRELPSYMVPRRVTVLESMPTNDNGKVDRKQLTKLAERTAVSKTTTSNVPPKNEDEQALCEEFSSVLGVDVGPTDDFFAMGGHSMMAMRLLPRVTDRLGWHILLQDLYQNSSPRALYDSQTSEMNGSAEASKWPSFMEVHEARGNQESLATLVLVHGFWGQGRIFAQLLPQLDERLDVIVLHDPFFGRVEGPQSLHEWSNFYLEELQKRLPRDSHVILGGYSFGCFTALQMASLWRKYFDVDPVSVALFDPAVWEPVNTDDLSEEFLEEKKAYGLRLFGEDQRAFVDEHFKKFGPLMASPREKPEYEGRILHIASSEVAAQGVPEWWAENYPGLQQECIDATHHGLFEWASASKQVGEVINEHCSRIWEGNDSLGRVVANGAAK